MADTGGTAQPAPAAPAPVDEGIFTRCTRCDGKGNIASLETSQKVLTVLVSLFLIGLLVTLGLCAQSVILHRLAGGKIDIKAPGAIPFFVASFVFGFARRLAMVEFKLREKW